MLHQLSIAPFMKIPFYPAQLKFNGSREMCAVDVVSLSDDKCLHRSCWFLKSTKMKGWEVKGEQVAKVVGRLNISTY